MLSKTLIKLVRSLDQKKNRLRQGLFVAEGPKVVGDLLRVYRPVRLISTSQWAGRREFSDGNLLVAVSDDELRKASFLQHPQQVVALFRLPEQDVEGDLAIPSRELCLALDGVQDPGNVGTIVRIADWFGIGTVYCSHDTADVFSPKVVQATMGSIAHVKIIYTNLPKLIDGLSADVPIYGTLLDGDNIYEQPLSSRGLIVMGNEGKGLSDAVRQHVNQRLLIPSFSLSAKAESLNVAIATAVVCAEFRRRMS